MTTASIVTASVCQICNGEIMKRIVAPGKYLVDCSGIECANSKHGDYRVDQLLDVRCPECKLQLVVKLARHPHYYGKMFVACTGYPNCKYIAGKMYRRFVGVLGADRLAEVEIPTTRLTQKGTVPKQLAKKIERAEVAVRDREVYAQIKPLLDRIDQELEIANAFTGSGEMLTVH